MTVARKYNAPTAEEWWAIIDAIRKIPALDNQLFTVELEGGGAACAFITIHLTDGRMLVLSDADETWTAFIYLSSADVENGEVPESYVELPVSSSVLDPAQIAFALALGMPGAENCAGSAANGFDYKHQAWVVDGRYEPCGHDGTHHACNCYGRLHAGEPVAADAEVR